MNGFLNTSNITDIDVIKESFQDSPIEIGTLSNQKIIVLETNNKGNNTLIMGRVVVEAGDEGAEIVMSIYKDRVYGEPIDIIEMPINNNGMETIDIFSYAKTPYFSCRKQRFILTISKKNINTSAIIKGYTISFVKFHK